MLLEPLHARAEVLEVAPSRWQLRLEIEPASRGGTRELVAATCDELARAAAMVIALGIDPNVADLEPEAASEVSEPSIDESAAEPTDTGRAASPRPSQPADQPQAPASPTAPQPPVQAVKTLPAQDRALRLTPHLRLLAALNVGDLPRLAPGARAAGGVTLHRTSVLLSASWVGWQQKNPTSSGGDFKVGATGLQVCQDLVGDRVGLGPCAALEVHWFHARGLGVDHDVTRNTLIVELGGGGVVTYPLVGQWSAVLEGMLLVPQYRPRFVVNDGQFVHTPAPYGGRLAMGLGLAL